MKLPAFPNLEGLISLARQDGVDVRPTLLRVLTDIYVQKPGHTRDEERRFTELGLWLLSSVDGATRAAVARKLAIHPQTPRAIALLLAADDFEIAEPVLRHSVCLTGEDLLAIGIERGGRHAATIAARDSVSATTAMAVDASDEKGPIEMESAEMELVPANQSMLHDMHRELTQELSGEAELDGAAPWAAQSDTGTSDVPAGERFLAAGPEERHAILAEVAAAAAGDAVSRPSTPEDAIARLEAAALGGRPDDFARHLQALLRVSRDRAQDIVEDARGDAVVIVARAIGMPTDVLLRVLLFLNPAVGQSVERVFALMELHYKTTPQVAARLVAGWHDMRPPERRVGRYQALHWDDEAGSRRASTDMARRAGSATPLERAQPARSGEAAAGERRQRTT